VKLRLRRLEYKESFYVLVKSLDEGINIYADQIKGIRSLISRTNEEYGKENLLDPQDDYDYIDLHYFAELVKQNIDDEVIRNHAQGLINAINLAIIHEWHQPLHPNSRGLSIFFPETISKYHSRPVYPELDFAKATGWDSFLNKYTRRVSCRVTTMASTMSKTSIEDVPIAVDFFRYKMPFTFGLFNGTHVFETIPTFVKDWEIFIFDHWKDETEDVVSRSYTFIYPVEKDKTFVAFFESIFSGTVVALHETQHKLYLHVYDELGRHVGLNYETNQTEVDIQDAYYADYLNGTIIVVLPPEISYFKVCVDSAYAQQGTETYNITIDVIRDTQLLSQSRYTDSIQQRSIQEYATHISDSGQIIITPISIPWWQHYWYILATFILIGPVTVFYLLLNRRKTRIKLENDRRESKLRSNTHQVFFVRNTNSQDKGY